MSENNTAAENTVSGKTLWHNSLQSFWAIRKQAGYIIFLTILLPQLLCTLLLDHSSMNIVDQLRAYVEQAASTNTDIRVLLQQVTPFFSSALSWSVGMLVLEISGAFALMICLLHYYEAQPSPGIGALIWAGFRLGMPAGLFLLVMIFMAALSTQVVFPPLILLVVPALMAPVLMAAERAGPLRALARALRFNYARQVRGGLFVVAMQVYSIAGSLYLATLGCIFAVSFIQTADLQLGISGRAWQPFTMLLPYGPMFALGQILELVLSSVLIWYFAAASVSLYALINTQERRLPNSGFLV